MFSREAEELRQIQIDTFAVDAVIDIIYHLYHGYSVADINSSAEIIAIYESGELEKYFSQPWHELSSFLPDENTLFDVGQGSKALHKETLSSGKQATYHQAFALLLAEWRDKQENRKQILEQVKTNPDNIKQIISENYPANYFVLP